MTALRPFLALTAALCFAAGCTAGSPLEYYQQERSTDFAASSAGAGYSGAADFLDVGINYSGDQTAGVFFNFNPSKPAEVVASRLVARNASMRVELPVVEDEKGKPDRKATDAKIEEAAKTAAALCKELKGWVVRESRDHVVLRVPSASLDTALKQIGALGEVTQQTLAGSDVTDEFRDNGIRLDNLEKSRQRYLKLLEAAEDVKAALAVEKELERVTLEIERLKGKQKSLETSVQFSLVSVQFAGAYPKKSGPMPGPLGWIFYGLWWFVKWLFVWE